MLQAEGELQLFGEERAVGRLERMRRSGGGNRRLRVHDLTRLERLSATWVPAAPSLQPGRTPRQRAARDLCDEGQHPLAQLVEQRSRHRTTRSAARRTTDARSASRSVSVTAWIVAGSEKGDANNDTTPMRAPGRQ